MATLTEDDLYRSSSQYRFWAFTPQALAGLRASTNTSAANAVKAAIVNIYRQEPEGGHGNDAAAGEGGQKRATVDCLTVEEEQKLVGFYCVKALQLADFCDFPTNVKVRRAGFYQKDNQLIDLTSSGHCRPISQTLLPIQLAHDLSP